MFRQLSLAGCALAFSATIVANTYTVTSAADSAPFAPDIPGTLRWAINLANANPGPDTIDFTIGGGGPVTIFPRWELPALADITGGTTIDGFTQPGGAGPGVAPPRTATLLVEIDGSFAFNSNGLVIHTDGNTVKGLVINRFPLRGIHVIGGAAGFLHPSANSNLIYANFVGTDPSGTSPAGNGAAFAGLMGAIQISNVPFGIASQNVVRGNLSSDNWSEGVQIEGPRQPGDVGHNTVEDNFIGTDVSGTFDLGNRHEGVAMTEGTHHNTIRRNLVSGNDTDGIGLQGFSNAGFGPPIQTRNNLIEENDIGVDINLQPLANGNHGIAVGEYGPSQWGCADHNTVRRNVIANNAGDGVAVWEDGINTVNADSNLISQNAIWDNAGLGIDLDNDGVTPNGPGAFGANQRVDYPVITNVSYSSGVTNIFGTVALGMPPSAIIEVFLVRPDATGHGEGRWYLGSVPASPDSNWSFSTDRAIPGDLLTATATDAQNNTSEFSFNGAVPGTPQLTATPRELPQRLAGVVNFGLSAGASRAGRNYVVLATLSGVAPGTSVFPLGTLTVPINFDGFTTAMLAAVNTPTFPNSYGTLDAGGNAAAQFNANTLAPIAPAQVGLVLHFAYVGVAPFDFTSNPVAIEIVGW